MTSDLERLALSTDDSGHWSWPDDDKANWKKVSTNQQFYEKWYSKPLDETQGFPYILPLGTDKDGRPLLDFRYDATAGSKIVVTEAYKNTYDRILKLREAPGGRGVVLTGQPGIGKTTFLKYLLVRLISARQPVLLYANGFTLFYAGNVYQAIHEPLSHIPKSAGKNLHEIWMLIDIDTDDKCPGLTGSTPVWPIQASPPHPKRWHAWSTQIDSTICGMPLWTSKELIFGFHLQKEYSVFLGNLKAALHPQSILSSAEDVAVKAALEVLKRDKEEEKEKAKFDSMDIDLGASESQVVSDLVDSTGKDIDVGVTKDQRSLDSMDAAIEVLIRDAIAEYGLAPRIVYRAIFRPYKMAQKLEEALANLRYQEFEDLVNGFCTKRALNSTTSHQLVSMSPVQHPIDPMLDTWTIDFSSIRIAKKAVIAMEKAEDQRLRHMYATLHNLAGSSGLAGCVFEALAHRRLSKGIWPGGQPTVVRMHPGGKERRSFSTPVILSTTDTSIPDLPVLRGEKMGIELIALTRSLDDFEPNTKTYYIPTASNNPLFDSFTIAFDDAGSTALISVFQMTISTSYEGSDNGYPLIRDIMIRLHQLYRLTCIKVTYWLVCPSSDKIMTWKMPNSWDVSAIVNDHRREVFCLRIPLGA